MISVEQWEIMSTEADARISGKYRHYKGNYYDGFCAAFDKDGNRHTIIIHESETMAQLILIPLQGPILSEYSAKATYKNERGFDDGTPYSFWRERSIKALRKENGSQQIIDLSNELLNEITPQTTADVNAFKERFSNNFLPFCQKLISKPKHRSVDSNLPDRKKLMNAYIKREKWFKALSGIKWFSGALTLICALLPVVLQLMQNARTSDNPVTFLTFWPWFVIAGIFLAATIILYVICPKTFCTFEGVDLEKYWKNA